MKKTFGSAFALIMVALFTVAPMSPATAYPGGIHLHLAGKVGQKAVGSTITFGAEGLTEAPQDAGQSPNSCLSLNRSLEAGGPRSYDMSPIPSGWNQGCGLFGIGSAKTFQIPGSGSFVGQIPLPALPAGEYGLGYSALPYGANEDATSIRLGVWSTIGEDGTFTAIGPACPGILIEGHCSPGG
jgi:hypothetical protein